MRFKMPNDYTNELAITRRPQVAGLGTSYVVLKGGFANTEH